MHAAAVLGEAGRSNQGGVHHGACLEHRAAGCTRGVDDGQHLVAQIVGFEQMVKAQDGGDGKGRVPCLACGRGRLTQRHKLRPRHHQVHLVKKPTLTRSLGDQLEPRVDKAHLFHTATISDSAFMGLTYYADHPKSKFRMPELIASSRLTTIVLSQAWMKLADYRGVYE